MTTFRSIKKEALGATVPVEILDAVIEEAGRRRISRSALTTLAICRLLGRDPRSYGLDARPERRGKKAAAAS